jgi:hypothetical protein
MGTEDILPDSQEPTTGMVTARKGSRVHSQLKFMKYQFYNHFPVYD